MAELARRADVRRQILTEEVTVVCLGLALPSPNRYLGRHWSALKRLRDHQHTVVWARLYNCFGNVPPALPLVVTLTRVTSGRPDGDNAEASAKWCRDAVARFLVTDDGSDLVTWRYRTARGATCLRIEFTPRGAEGDEHG